MSIQHTVFNNSGNTEHVSIDRYPDICPYCHCGMEPHYLSGYFQKPQNQLFLSFYCTRKGCESLFVGVYNLSNNGVFYFQATLLGRRQKKLFSPMIVKISPDFVKIYNQSEIAEESHLDEVCGPGFRKSLEFLIKDYIIGKDPSIKEKVESKQLGPCIDAYISGAKIKALAKRAVWIGNDETHYIKKWITKDINDLKKFIDLVLHWIETEILTEEMINDMPDSGPV